MTTQTTVCVTDRQTEFVGHQVSGCNIVFQELLRTDAGTYHGELLSAIIAAKTPTISAFD